MRGAAAREMAQCCTPPRCTSPHRARLRPASPLATTATTPARPGGATARPQGSSSHRPAMERPPPTSFLEASICGVSTPDAGSASRSGTLQPWEMAKHTTSMLNSDCRWSSSPRPSLSRSSSTMSSPVAASNSLSRKWASGSPTKRLLMESTEATCFSIPSRSSRQPSKPPAGNWMGVEISRCLNLPCVRLLVCAFTTEEFGTKTVGPSRVSISVKLHETARTVPETPSASI
mmetsp:Transcript_86955/g.274571  ORF Transcript_86955/g.274571 Transcript_86955/m.274571 type:complete len:232 (+) Transcript_86955:249-944(+)